MIRHIVPALSIGIAGALAAAPAARAQSSLPGAAAIAAAHHAVDATDAHTAAMTSPAVFATASVARPAASVASASRPTSAAQTRAATPATATTKAPAKAAPGAAPAASGAARGDSAPAVAIKTGKNVMSFTRETYSYAGGGRRDPFKSLLAAGGDLRPLMSDLRLVTIVYGTNGQNSVAILRDLTTKEQYRVRVGQTLGRMRVASIEPRQVVFTIEEFGYSRQETLMYNDPNSTRSK